MPISSGALDWPVSHFSKPEGELETGLAPGDSNLAGSKKSPRQSTETQGYQWTPQLTNREDYEKWRKKMDRKEPLKTKRKKRGGCCGFLASNKLNTENEDPTKGVQRTSPRDVIKRRRRRWCCLLAAVLSVVTFALLAVVVFVYLRYVGDGTLGPDDLVECTGQWRSHFLAYELTSGNGSTVYVCCYLPNIENVTMWTTLGKSGWPDGYVIPQSKCTVDPSKSSWECKDYEKSGDFLTVGTTAPCGVAKHGPATLPLWLGVLAALLIMSLP